MGADPGAQQMAWPPSSSSCPAIPPPVDPRMPDPKKIKLINYDYAKYGARPSAAA
jgi:iron(III) transport system substrate-binding protein